jgi:hypothetical protein
MADNLESYATDGVINDSLSASNPFSASDGEKVAGGRMRCLTERGERVGVRSRNPQQAAFFGYLAPEAREILNELLQRYATDGELQFTLPDVLQIPPITRHGNVNEIIGKFGGADQLRNAVSQLQTLLYAKLLDANRMYE